MFVIYCRIVWLWIRYETRRVGFVGCRWMRKVFMCQAHFRYMTHVGGIYFLKTKQIHSRGNFITPHDTTDHTFFLFKTFLNNIHNFKFFTTTENKINGGIGKSQIPEWCSWQLNEEKEFLLPASERKLSRILGNSSIFYLKENT